MNTRPSMAIKHTGTYVYIKHNLQGHEHIKGSILNVVWFVGERMGVEIRGKRKKTERTEILPGPRRRVDSSEQCD